MKLNASLGKNQFAPLTKIHQWTNSASDLFDTIFVYQKLSSDKVGCMPWEILNEEASIDVRNLHRKREIESNKNIVSRFNRDHTHFEQARLPFDF
jgi:hypothetical protein